MSTVKIGDDLIDSRDIESRIDELRDELAGTPFADDGVSAAKLKVLLDETPDEWFVCVDNLDADTVSELIALVDFKESAESAHSKWFDGATFILDSYFKEYAQELAEDIGAINRDARWPNDCIDWDQAADELKADYSTIEVGEHTYYVRA